MQRSLDQHFPAPAKTDFQQTRHTPLFETEYPRFAVSSTTWGDTQYRHGIEPIPFNAMPGMGMYALTMRFHAIHVKHIWAYSMHDKKPIPGTCPDMGVLSKQSNVTMAM